MIKDLWITKDGAEIRICDMSTQDIENAMRLLYDILYHIAAGSPEYIYIGRMLKNSEYKPYLGYLKYIKYEKEYISNIWHLLEAEWKSRGIDSENATRVEL